MEKNPLKIITNELGRWEKGEWGSGETPYNWDFLLREVWKHFSCRQDASVRLTKLILTTMFYQLWKIMLQEYPIQVMLSEIDKPSQILLALLQQMYHYPYKKGFRQQGLPTPSPTRLIHSGSLICSSQSNSGGVASPTFSWCPCPRTGRIGSLLSFLC